MPPWLGRIFTIWKRFTNWGNETARFSKFRKRPRGGLPSLTCRGNQGTTGIPLRILCANLEDGCHFLPVSIVALMSAQRASLPFYNAFHSVIDPGNCIASLRLESSP